MTNTHDSPTSLRLGDDIVVPQWNTDGRFPPVPGQSSDGETEPIASEAIPATVSGVRQLPIPREWRSTLAPSIIAGERRRYFGDIQPSLWLDTQTWMSIDPESRVDYEIAAMMPPYTVAFDFQTFEAADRAEIRVEIMVHGPTIDQTSWRLQEVYEVGVIFQGVKQGDPGRAAGGRGARTYLSVNEEPISRGRFLTIEPLSGPWPTRIIYRQMSGMNKFVRFLMLPQ